MLINSWRASFVRPAVLSAALIATALFAFVGAPAFGAETVPQPALESAVRTLERANDGDDSAIEPALKEFTRLNAAYPGDPLLLCYLGTITAMRANTTILPWRKMGYAEDGLALIDKSLALLTPAHDAPRPDGTPVSLETRFTAGSTFVSLPGFFNRRARGEQLLKEVMASPQLAGSALSMRGAVWLRAGVQAIEDKRLPEARKWLQQVLASNAPQAGTARARLKEIGS